MTREKAMQNITFIKKPHSSVPPRIRLYCSSGTAKSFVRLGFSDRSLGSTSAAPLAKAVLESTWAAFIAAAASAACCAATGAPQLEQNFSPRRISEPQC